MQKILNSEQISAFYHDCFVRQQVEHFTELVGKLDKGKGRVVADVGGGCGYFAHAIQRDLGLPSRVIDMDPVSVESARKLGVEAYCGDALNPPIFGDEKIICFNLILHHLVASTESDTRKLQKDALMAWKNTGSVIYVNEYIYESWLENFSGWVIYQITKSSLLSFLAKGVSLLIPSLRANTFGVGVRFRSHDDWLNLFEETGFKLISFVKGNSENISLPRRLLLIQDIRRDSFMLVPR